MQAATTNKLPRDVIKAYEAPFPDDSFKAAPRIMPSLIPISTDDPEHKANKKAIEMFRKWEKPFLTAFSDGDPVTRGGDKFWQKNVPGTQGQKHTTIKNAGHFVQEDKGPELAELLLEFIKNNPK
jgi:haloalkane dehalogenase